MASIGATIYTMNVIRSETLILVLILSKLAFRIKSYTMIKSTKTSVYTGNTNDVTIITVLTVSGLVEGL